MPLISIIIPVYNVEAYLSECLDSIINQTFDNYEVILVDDGSTDKSSNICDEYAGRCQQVKVIHQKNGGVSAARNTGLDIAQGEWVWFVDADDYIKKSSLDILSQTIFEQSCDTIFSGLFHVYEDGKIKEDFHNKDFTSDKNGLLLHNNCFQNGMILFDNAIIQRYHLRFSIGVKMGEDLEFQYKYLMLCNKPIRIKDCLYYYRRREGSAIANPDSAKNNMRDNIRNAKSLLTFIVGNNIQPQTWIESRICMMLKASLQSALDVRKEDRRGLDKELKDILKNYKNVGFSEVQDRTLWFASHFPQLYLFALFFYLKRK